MSWCIEASDEHGRPVWLLQDAPGERGTVWARFYDRVAATACLKGLRVFTPERPEPRASGKVEHLILKVEGEFADRVRLVGKALDGMLDYGYRLPRSMQRAGIQVVRSLAANLTEIADEWGNRL